MNKFLLIIALCSSFFVSGQKSVLKKLNFDEGKWGLFGISIDNDKNSLHDSLGDFFTKDKELLNAIKSFWKLKNNRGMSACGYHYKLLFIQNNTFAYSFMLNLNCKELVYVNNWNCYKFPESKLREFFPYLKKIPKTSFEVNNLQQARKLCSHLSLLDTVIFSSEDYMYWSYLSGVLKIEVKDSIIKNEKVVEKYVYDKIKKDYPFEVFELRRGSASLIYNGVDTYEYNIYCSQKMGSNFKMYKILSEWEAYSKLIIDIYGLTEEQIIKVLKSIK